MSVDVEVIKKAFCVAWHDQWIDPVLKYLEKILVKLIQYTVCALRGYPKDEPTRQITQRMPMKKAFFGCNDDL